MNQKFQNLDKTKATLMEEKNHQDCCQKQIICFSCYCMCSFCYRYLFVINANIHKQNSTILTESTLTDMIAIIHITHGQAQGIE